MGAGTVPIELDKPRELRFDHNALADLDLALVRDMNTTLFEAFQSAAEDQVPRALASFAGARLAIWAGLKAQDRSMTIARAGQIISMAYEKGVTLQDVAIACVTAIASSGCFGDPDALAEPEGKTETVPEAAPAP